MNTINMPGFTAGASLYKTSQHYQLRSVSTPLTFGVQAAQLMSRMALGRYDPPAPRPCADCELLFLACIAANAGNCAEDYIACTLTCTGFSPVGVAVA